MGGTGWFNCWVSLAFRRPVGRGDMNGLIRRTVVKTHGTTLPLIVGALLLFAAGASADPAEAISQSIAEE